jgi:hypothetical protein
MKLTVLGIAIVAYGTYLTFTDKWKVAGVVLIGVGTLLATLAQRRDSTADVRKIEATLQKKLTEVHQEIASAKALSSPAESAKKLDQIDRAFAGWAKDFVRDKERRKLEVEQTRVADKQKELDDSETWRPVLELFLVTVGGAARAYAKETGTPIEVQLPQLPTNLYDKNIRYAGRIAFRKDVVWQIELDHSTDFMGVYPPLAVTLLGGRAADDDVVARLWSMSQDSHYVIFSVTSDVLPKLPGINGTFQKATYRTEFPKAVSGGFAAQMP